MAIKYKNLEFEGLSDDRLLFYLFWASIILIAIEVGIIIFSFSKLPPQIPFFYSKPWGDSILAAPQFIWLLPGASIAVLSLNSILGLITLKVDGFLRRTFFIGTFFIIFCSLWATFQIVNLLI